jgi:arylformamidase
MTFWDISPLISPRLAVWPGDTPLSRELLADISQGTNIDLSTIRATVHLGAHADAPHHYHRDGISIEAVDLEAYMGACYVHTVASKPLIEASDCALPLASGAVRILFRTNSYPNPEVFNRDFTAFHPDAVEVMGRAGVRLIGIDTPSVDSFSSKDLPSHQNLFRHKIANLEGLVLTAVSDGHYELIALPLKLDGFDASPVRAILRRQ